jgi:hypothetical protein
VDEADALTLPHYSRHGEREVTVTDVDEFLASMLPRMLEVDTALHKGDAGPRSTLWSHHDPVTLFGAAVSKSGWAEVSAAFEWLASRFSNFESARAKSSRLG